jgi:hypothetical protein
VMQRPGHSVIHGPILAHPPGSRLVLTHWAHLPLSLDAD